MSSFGKNKVQLWETSLERLGRILSDEYGIKVIFKYDVCLTTKTEIYLPVIPEGARQEFLDAVQGYLDHEVSHILHTEFDLIKEAATQKGKKHQLLLNALEDGRVEEEMKKLWRGSKINLNNCREWSLEQVKDKWNELSEFGKVIQGVASLATSPEDHWFTTDVVMKDTETWDKLEKIKDIALRAPKMADTRECYEQAQEIMRILDEDDVPVPESEFGGEGEEGQDGQGLSGDEQILSDAEKIKDQAAKDRFKFEREEDRYLIYTTEGDTIEAIDDEGDKQQCHRFLTDSRGLVYPIRQRFRRNLLSKAKCRWEPGKRRGSVNPASLHRVALGTSKAVFRKLSEADSFDTAVSMFVDHSGSMWSEKMELAAHTAIIFGECLHDIKVPFEVCGFSTQQSSIAHTRFQGASPDEQKLFTRWGDLWIGIYKGFDDHWPTNRHRCVNMNRNGKDNTFDGEALRVAAKRLLLRPEKRKILFWLNDGWPQPNMSRFRQQHATYLANMAKAVEKVIEVFAVGIMSDSVKEYFSNWVQVNNLSDLPKVAVTELDRLLRKRQNAYGGTRVA